ncbi:hypothetical protein JTP77_021055, partial [Streptomyces sp. S9]|nr:hypothetical protein [Streptomyces sp. S9]
MNAELPPVAPEVVAAAVESLTARLRKKLDAAIESYAALPVTAADGAVRVRCGEDAEVTLTPGPSGAVTDAAQAVCGCLLAPRCLHRAAVLGACPVADAEALTEPAGPAEKDEKDEQNGSEGPVPVASDTQGDPAPGSDETSAPAPPTPAQVTAAAGLWAAAAVTW